MNGNRINFFIRWILNLLLMLIISCKAGGKFEGLDATLANNPLNNPVTVKISTYTPAVAPVNIISTSTTTFGITLAESDETVLYTFVLDNTNTLQSGTSPFYNLQATGLTAGAHTLKVTASNTSSTDQHIFNIIVNAPTVIASFTPTMTGTTLSCGLASQGISALYSEIDTSDTVNVKWYLNDELVSFGNSTATVTNDPGNSVALLNFHPTCAQTGINFIRVVLNDGHETTSLTWTIYVTAPIVLSISDSTPMTDPTVLTATTAATFGVTLGMADPSANFQFVLDNAITAQNDHRAYYSLTGAALTTGTHTLKVTAVNVNSSAVKTFNIRKNAPPTVSAFSPSYSGTSINCGSAPITLYADMSDLNGDSLTYTWLVDDVPSAYIIPANSGSRVQASFSPNCAIAGTRVIKAVVNDGYENTVVNWSVTVASPINVTITSYLPATNPTIITANQTTTFVVALSTSDSNVTYNFVLKNLSTLVSTTLQTGTVPFFNLIGSTIEPALYELKVTATNGTSSDSHIFTVRKNSPPSVPPVPLTFTPVATDTTLSCGSSQLFQSYISDADSDIMSVTWYLDNTSGLSNLVNTSSTTEAKGIYTPTCAEVGIKTIRVDVYDGHEITSRSWTVNIVNPTIVAINAYSPGTDPVNVLSTGSQSFTVSATGKAPIAYEWKLDNILISSATNAFYTITASSLSVGTHTLSVRVYDSSSEQSKTWNIIRNTPPTLSLINPSNLNPKINVNTLINFSASFADANNDSVTVTWKLNDQAIVAGNIYGLVTTVASSTNLRISPLPALLGNNKIELIVSDGKESTSQVWNLNINYLSDVCNNLGAGKICTLLGQPGLGSNINPILNPEKVRLQPSFITDYDGTSFFFSDPTEHVIWFYNKGATPITILGQTIAAGKLSTVVGLGVCGWGTDGITFRDYPICNPRGLAWDNANGRLYFADEGNWRVGMIDSTGLVKRIFGGAGWGSTSNIDGSLAINHICPTPRDLAYDSTTKRLYVSCYGSGSADDTFMATGAASIKYVDTTNASYTNFTAYTLVGATSGGLEKRKIVVGKIGATTAPDASTSTAMVQTASNLKLDSANGILYYNEMGNPGGSVSINACQIMAVNLTATVRTNYFFNAITLPAYSTVQVLGGVCNSNNNVASAVPYSSAYTYGGWMPFELRKNGTTLEGFYVGSSDINRIAFYNNTASSITVGNQAVPAYNAQQFWGNGIGGFEPNCTAANNNCYILYPLSLSQIGTKLYLADFNNFRIRSVATNVANGAHVVELGVDSHAGFAGNGGTSSVNVQFNTPMELFFDTSSNKLIISDMNNNRIRSMNASTGRVDQFIGNGYGNANISQADPSSVGMYAPRQVINYQNNYIYADAWQNNGTTNNVNCNLRIWNTDSAAHTLFNVLTNANSIQTFVGSFANGCGPLANPSIPTTGTSATVRLHIPIGVTTNGNDIYFTNTGDHCILKLDSSGNLSVFSGLCGTSGATNNGGLAYNSATIRFRAPGAVAIDTRSPYFEAGNIFILDQTEGSAVSAIRYINQYTSAVTIFGVTIAPGEIKTIYQDATSFGASLAIFDPMVCMSSGGNVNHQYNGNSSVSSNNVICLSRDNDGTTIKRFGRNPANYFGRGYIQQDTEEEGAAADQVGLGGPSGITFDGNGNLYIAERFSHTIRMVKKWW